MASAEVAQSTNIPLSNTTSSNSVAAAAAAAPASSKRAVSQVYATQHNILLQKLIEYFSKDDFAALDLILPIINGEDKISLRLVDWFVTNYAKKVWTTYKNKSGRRFVVHAEYKLRLNSYKKKRFDPFCRWERTQIPYRDDSVVSTTVGQLNFFKWALENKVIDFIREHQEAIEKDMNSRNSTARARPKKSDATSSAAGEGTSEGKSENRTRRRRQELTTSPVRSMCRQEAKIKISFT
jgi:hypothetical protein